MGVDVLSQASEAAGCDLATVPSVWATAHGEHSTAMSLLGMMQQGSGKVSPTHFHNSVHNTSSGYASIAVGNCAPSVTLTGGAELVVAALLEAMCQLEATGGEILVVLADEALRPPFERADVHAPLALALCLSASSEGASAVLSELRRDTVAPVKPHGRFGGLHVSAALPLLEHIELRRPGTVPLEFEGDASGAVWCVDVELVDASGSPC
jgi:hypothetical protein